MKTARFPRPLLALLLVLTFPGCTPHQTEDDVGGPAADAAHGSRDSIDWAGTYEGILPCVGCPGTQARLTLNRDQTFELSTLPLDIEGRASVVQGTFSWWSNGNAISLEGPDGGQQFAVGEGRVALLMDGAEPAWPQPPQRVLEQVRSGIVTDMEHTLESHRWTLTSGTYPPVGDAVGPSEPPRPVVLSFSEGRLNIQGRCNRLFGGYELDGGGQLVVGQLAATMISCSPELMAVDAELAALLETPVRIELGSGEPRVLSLLPEDRAAFVFEGQLTPEARYGPPTRVFLEVAAQTVDCATSGEGESRCLQVRELQFDEQGLAVGTPGEWQVFADAIEGYTHETGIRNVLRLNRFERGDESGTSRHVFILDMVVESAIESEPVTR